MPARRPYPLRAGAVLLLVAASLGVGAATSTADLSSRIDNVKSKAGALKSSIDADSQHIERYQGHIDDLQQRLSALQDTINQEQAALAHTQASLRAARARLFVLRGRLAHDKQVLAAQLVARYESGPPDIVSVLFNAHGFADLLETVDALRRVGQQNTEITRLVGHAKTAVRAQTVQYSALEAQQQRQTSAVLVQRNQVALIKFTIVKRQEKYVESRNRKSAAFNVLHARAAALEEELRAAQARAAAAQAAAFNAQGIVTPPATIGSFAAHGGSYGFFQSPGTNYAVGDEPALAAKLDALGKALHLHLTGLSGYRTPQHSVEVGGFPNDPHTKGQASDTPGVEGVSEATLNQFGLTRPFGGAAEADHIQLVGSI